MIKSNDTLATVALLLIGSLIAPLILIPLERVFAYPYILEEMTKLVFVFYLLKTPKTLYWKLLILVGFLFSFSESIFYLADAYSRGNTSLFGTKLLFTFLLHTGTLFILYIPTLKNKNLIILALPITILIHYLFNGGRLPL